MSEPIWKYCKKRQAYVQRTEDSGRPYTLLLVGIISLAALVFVVSGVLAVALADSVHGVIAGGLGAGAGFALVAIVINALGE